MPKMHKSTSITIDQVDVHKLSVYKTDGGNKKIVSYDGPMAQDSLRASTMKLIRSQIKASSFT